MSDMRKSPLKSLPDEAFAAIASRFRALGEVSRLRIVEALHSGEKNVTELVEITGLSQPNVSRHLQVLVTAGLIGRKKEGLTMRYRIVDDTLSDVCAIVCKRVSDERRGK